MNVSAIVVTRGDVSMVPVMESLPMEWERMVWNNDGGLYYWDEFQANFKKGEFAPQVRHDTDLGVYGRYAAIEYASHDLIYVQDDDCIVSDPQAIVDEWKARAAGFAAMSIWPNNDHVVCNMPERFRGQGLYATGEHALVGFGAAFHRDAPDIAFRDFYEMSSFEGDWPFFHRTCDIVFTALTPRVLVDIPYEDLPHAHAPNRMFKQKEHVAERQRMLELVRQVNVD